MPDIPYHDEPLPDISGCWICVNLIAERLLSKCCSIDDAICTLEKALCRGVLRSQTQSCPDHRRIEPSEWVTPLQLTLRESADGWFVEVTYRETGEPLQANLYLWEPDYNRVWATEPEIAVVSPPPTPPKPKSTTKQKPPPKPPKWITFVDSKINAEIDQNGRFSELGMARDVVVGLLEDRKKKQKKGSVPRDRTIERGIRNHRPHWVED